VLKLIRDSPETEFRLATIIPRDWRIPARALPTVKPKQHLERFRQQLVRAGLHYWPSNPEVGIANGNVGTTFDAIVACNVNPTRESNRSVNDQ
jgi:hypothetical protein